MGVYAQVTHDSIGLVQGASGTERRQRLILHSVPQFTRNSVGYNVKTGPYRAASRSSVGYNVKTGPYCVPSHNSVGRNMIRACFGVACLDVLQHGSRHGLTSARFSRDSWLLRDFLALAALVVQGFLEVADDFETTLREDALLRKIISKVLVPSRISCAGACYGRDRSERASPCASHAHDSVVIAIIIGIVVRVVAVVLIVVAVIIVLIISIVVIVRVVIVRVVV